MRTIMFVEGKLIISSFRDVLIGMGQIPARELGYEASGIVTRVGREVTDLAIGDHVYALGYGTHRSILRNKSIMFQRMPAGLDFEEAATLPIVHCPAYNAIVRIAKAIKGQTILIHAAAGGVGQAAIQIANHLELEIYATVSSSEKRQLLKETYQIPDSHIFSSRDTSFAKGVMRMTNGRGVHIVLNSLAGELLRQSFYCLAQFGTFIEIGMRDLQNNSRLDMRPFLRDATFVSFNLHNIMQTDPGVASQLMKCTFDLLRQGVIEPATPVSTFPLRQVKRAFRLLQTGKHMGKIALSWENNEAYHFYIRRKTY